MNDTPGGHTDLNARIRSTDTLSTGRGTKTKRNPVGIESEVPQAVEELSEAFNLPTVTLRYGSGYGKYKVR